MSTGSPRPAACRFCGRAAEIEVLGLDPILPVGAPQPVCRFCLGRPHRQAAVTEGARTIRLRDLATGKTATGRPEEIVGLLGTLARERGERTITAAIRVSSYQQTPISLHCAGCGGTLTPDKGGFALWRPGPDGRWCEARLFHGAACAEQVGEQLRPGCWVELESLGQLDLTRFDVESMGYLTDVEIAWSELKKR